MAGQRKLLGSGEYNSFGFALFLPLAFAFFH